MDILKGVFIVLYLIVAVALIVLSFIQTKQDKQNTAIMGAGKDSFYEKNKSRTKEAKMDFAIVVLFVIFVIGSFGLYFI